MFVTFISFWTKTTGIIYYSDGAHNPDEARPEIFFFGHESAGKLVGFHHQICYENGKAVTSSLETLIALHA